MQDPFFPKIIGRPGDCFAKCRDAVGFSLGQIRPHPWNYEAIFSCRYAKTLGCKTKEGAVGYMSKRTGAWRTCIKGKGRAGQPSFGTGFIGARNESYVPVSG